MTRSKMRLIVAVVGIVALAAAGIAFMVMPRQRGSDSLQARISAHTIGEAVASYVATKNAECATVDELIESDVLDSEETPTVDPWGQEFHVLCQGSSIAVTSAGPDRKLETADDVAWRQR